jgi:hypothetical protein
MVLVGESNMRVGTVLRILGLIIFFAGIIGGVLIGYGAQPLIVAFSKSINENTLNLILVGLSP